MAIVSNSWVVTEKDTIYCYWPSYVGQSKLNKLIIEHADIEFDKSQKCAVNIKYKSKLYSQAVEKMKTLESVSSVSQTEEDDDSIVKKSTIKRKIKKKTEHYSQYELGNETDDDDYDLPTVPQPQNKPLASQHLSEPEPSKRSSTKAKLTLDAVKDLESEAGSSVYQLSEPFIPQTQKKILASQHLSEPRSEPRPTERERLSSINAKQVLDEVDELESPTGSSIFVLEHPSPDSNSDVTITNNANSSPTFLCNGCKKSEELLPEIMAKVEAMAEDIKYLLLCHQTELNKDEISSDFTTCETKEQLINLDESLHDPKIFHSMCLLFQTVGGKDTVDTTRRILLRLMSNDLAMSYNWTGRNMKENFSKLGNILKLILVAVRKNPLSRNTTEQEAHQVIKKFLRNACDRDGGRGKRTT